MVDLKPTVLIVEDDEAIRRFVRTNLQIEGYRVLEATTIAEASTMIPSHRPEIILLDLGLPDGDGKTLLAANTMGKVGRPGVIVLSARDNEREKIEALDAGADDYLTKPFSIGELKARLRVVYRRKSNIDQEGGHIFKVRDLSLDLERRKLLVRGTQIHLTPREFALLALLARHAGKVITHNRILEEIWGTSTSDDGTRLRVFVANLRRKIEIDSASPEYLQTEVGVGYRLLDE